MSKTNKVFAVGDEVYRFDNYPPKVDSCDGSLQAEVGVVKSVLANGQASIEWKSGWGAGKTTKAVNTRELYSPADGEEEISRLVKEFDAFNKEIAKKLKQAGKLISGANDLANEAGHELIFLDGMSELKTAMEEVGWNTSSIFC